MFVVLLEVYIFWDLKIMGDIGNDCLSQHKWGFNGFVDSPLPCRLLFLLQLFTHCHIILLFDLMKIKFGISYTGIGNEGI